MTAILSLTLALAKASDRVVDAHAGVVAGAHAGCTTDMELSVGVVDAVDDALADVERLLRDEDQPGDVAALDDVALHAHLVRRLDGWSHQGFYGTGFRRQDE